MTYQPPGTPDPYGQQPNPYAQPGSPAAPGSPITPEPYAQPTADPYAQPAAGYPQQQPYQQPYAQQPYVQQPYAVARPTNTMAIVALVCAFVFAPLAIVFGHMAKKQIAQTGEEGSGLATAGLVIGYVFTGIYLLACCGAFAIPLLASAGGY